LRQRPDSAIGHVLGDGFALLTTPGTAVSDLARVPADLGTRVAINRVTLDDDSTLAAFLPALPPGFLLLRPDRYVAAFLPVDGLAAALDRVRRLFASTWPPAAAASSDEVLHAP
jgi:hypothetical protein